MRIRLRVGLDAGPWLDHRTGVGRYSYELAGALERLGVQVVPFAVTLRGARHNGVRRWRVPARAAQAVWRRFDGPRITRLTGPVDVVHGTNFVLPALGDAPGVVTVHDLSFYRDDAFPGAVRLRDLVPWSVERAARILTPTEAVAGEVRARFGVSGPQVVAVPEGVGPLFFGATPLSDVALAGMGIVRPFALAVATIEPRKNLRSLVTAWGAVREELPAWTLVIAGPEGWGPQLPATPGVVPLGWVGDETLPGLLAAAELFCYPSLYEGFGLPPLEAMAAGTATLVGNYPAAGEVLGDAALIVDGSDPSAIAEGLREVATDPEARARLARAGRARAGRYTWEKTALDTLAAYEAAMAE